MPDNELRHFGVKGMKWGVRKADRNAPRAVATKQKPGDYIQSKGGKRQPGSEDAFRTQTYRQMAKASTTDSLSNKELQALVNRMNLEQNYARLKKQEDRRTRGKRAVGRVINLIKGDPNLGRDAAENVKTAFDMYGQYASEKAARSPRAVNYPVVESTVVRR